jgi:ABC-type glycerol-3-phosphate transport system substrate-binding protein
VNIGGRRLVVLVLSLAWLVAACGTGATPTPPSTAPSAAPPSVAASEGPSAPASAAAVTSPITVYGAASLKGALDKMKTAWEAANPGSTLTI